MIYKKIQLSETNKNIYMDAYIADKISGYTRSAILVIPGGGYAGICDDREGEPIALAFMAHGFNAFVLHYSVKENSKQVYPTQLIEGAKAIKHIKDNACEYGIDKERVFTCGFSAGGHLAATLGILWDDKAIYEEINMPFGYNKPKGIMPIYPLVSGVEEFSTIDCFYNLLGTQSPSTEQLKEVSLELRVSENSAPAYIVHTSNDETVSVKNSLCLAQAYADCGAEFELHIYPDAPHGVALGNEITKCGIEKYDNPAIADWVKNAAYWAKNLK